MTHKIHDIGLAKHIGTYSDAIESAPNLRWLHSSGTPGLTDSGDVPKDITGQSELAWEHIMRTLKEAKMTAADLVKVTTYLTRAEDIAAYVTVRKRFLGAVRPALMLLVVPQLVWPEILVEIEVMRRKPEPDIRSPNRFPALVSTLLPVRRCCRMFSRFGIHHSEPGT